MPDAQILPHGRTLHPIPLPDGALEDIRARARRRKAERAAVTGSAAGMAAVLTAAAVLSGGLLDPSHDSLRIGPATPPLVEAPVAPPQSAPPEQEALSAPAAPAGPSLVQAAPVAPRVASPARPAPPPAEPTARGAMRHDLDPVRTAGSVVLLLPYCEAYEQQPVSGWCAAATADPAAERLGLLLCRAQGQGPGRLDWRDSQQVDFEVRDEAGAVVWTYDPRVRPEPSSLTVPAEGCVIWELSWPATDEQGQPLRPGGYTLRATSTATGLQGVAAEMPFRSPQDPETSPLSATPSTPSCTDEIGHPPGCAGRVRPQPVVVR